MLQSQSSSVILMIEFVLFYCCCCRVRIICFDWLSICHSELCLNGKEEQLLLKLHHSLIYFEAKRRKNSFESTNERKKNGYTESRLEK